MKKDKFEKDKFEKIMLTDELITRETQGWNMGTFNILPNPDKILRKTGKTIESYRDLKNDPHVWSCIQSRKSGLIALPYKITAGNASSEIVRRTEEMLAELDIQKIERDILEAPLFGFQPLEVIWSESADKRYIIPTDIVAKPQEWFFYDNKGELRFRKAGEPKGVEIPPMKIINVRYEASYNNPYGHALLGKCYWSVTFKNSSMKYWVTFAEKYGMPILMGQYSRGASIEEAERLADHLNNMTEDSVIVAPSDITLQLHEATRGTSSSLYRDMIKFCNNEISKALLSQTLTTELDMGSYAAAQTHFLVRKEVIQSDKRLVELVFDRLIRMYIDLNYAPPYPKFSIMVNDTDNLQRVERDVRLTNSAGLRLSKDYWINTYGFAEGDFE